MKTFLIYSIVDYIVNSCCHEINRKFNEFCIQNSQIVLQPDCFYEKIKSKHTYTNCHVDKTILATDGSVYGYLITYKIFDDTLHPIRTTIFIRASNIKYAKQQDTVKTNQMDIVSMN